MLAVLWIAAIVAVGYWIMSLEEKPARPEPMAGPMTGRELSRLVLVDYDPDLVLVTPRGVELPFCSDWALDDVMETLAEVDAL